MSHLGASARVSFGVKALCVFVLTLAVSLASNAVFLDEIGDFDGGTQSTYIIDGYYYQYLGERTVHLAQSKGISVYEAAREFSPNESSAGVVFLSALVSSLLPYRELLPLLFLVIFFVLIGLLHAVGRATPSLLFLPLSGLLPYLFITSKEAFFVMGFLMLLLGYLRRWLLPLALLGGAMMYLARQEGFYILLCAWLIWMCSVRRWTLLVAIGTILIFYFLRFREPLFAISSLFQTLSDDADTSFCKSGPFSVCVDSLAGAETIYLQRVVTLVGLPFKWLMDAGAAVIGMTTWPGFVIRLALVVHITWGWWVLRHRVPLPDERLRKVVRISLWFFVAYCAVYGSLFYFQSTRQVVLATTILFISLSLNGNPTNAIGPSFDAHARGRSSGGESAILRIE